MITLRRRRAAPDRLATAPAGYAAVHARADLLRHAALLDPLPGWREVRVALTPGRVAGTWNLDLAARDRPGLLARFAGVLAANGVDVAQAVVATWDDGAALQAFVTRTPNAPDAHEFARALERQLVAVPVDAAVTFDDTASPVYTLCRVDAPDRPGLLHALAAAFATAEVDIHAAAVTTVGDRAHDRFDVTEGAGQQLSQATRAKIEQALRGGSITRPLRPRGVPTARGRRPTGRDAR